MKKSTLIETTFLTVAILIIASLPTAHASGGMVTLKGPVDSVPVCVKVTSIYAFESSASYYHSTGNEITLKDSSGKEYTTNYNYNVNYADFVGESPRFAVSDMYSLVQQAFLSGRPIELDLTGAAFDHGGACYAQVAGIHGARLSETPCTLDSIDNRCPGSKDDIGDVNPTSPSTIRTFPRPLK